MKNYQFMKSAIDGIITEEQKHHSTNGHIQEVSSLWWDNRQDGGHVIIGQEKFFIDRLSPLLHHLYYQFIRTSQVPKDDGGYLLKDILQN